VDAFLAAIAARRGEEEPSECHVARRTRWHPSGDSHARPHTALPDEPSSEKAPTENEKARAECVVKFFVTVGRRFDFTKEKTPVNLTLDGNIETDSTESADCRRFQARTD
jgi:hypothetical protein